MFARLLFNCLLGLAPADSQSRRDIFFLSSTAMLKPFLTASVLLALTLTGFAARAATSFSRDFAPSEGMVAPAEQPWREEMCLNGRWRFQPVALPPGYVHDRGAAPALTSPKATGWAKTPIKIPSPWNVNAFNRGDGGDFRCYPSYPASWDTAEMGWMERTFTVPAAWRGRRLRLHFEAVAGDAVVRVNGKEVGHNFDSFLPFECDVTGAVKYGGISTVQVGVRKPSLFNDTRTRGSRPYPGGSFWGQAIAGIWQDVFLLALPPVHAENVLIEPQVSSGILRAEVTLRNDTSGPQTVRVSGMVSPWINLAGKSVTQAPEPKWQRGAAVLTVPAQSVRLTPGETRRVTLAASTRGTLKLWTPDTPHLYGLTVGVSQSGKTVDSKYTRFGWREFTFDGNRQLLNGKPLELRGDSWHFLGIPQMTRRYAWAWYTALKAAHGNAVRLHAQPYPALYLDMADEMGVCVLDETANWGSDGQNKYDTPEFWTRANDEVNRLVLRDRNHASVFGWSVSNEVAWFIDRDKHPEQFDRLTQGWRDWAAAAHRLDPTRPWVSTDGDGDGEGAMPTVVLHYASLEGAARGSKPYGMGETGGAYSDTPKQMATYAGPRAYASDRGRMEGVAVQAYELISTERQQKTDYASVFNLVWYGLQPLELGLSDTSQSYTLTDGVFFGAYKDGKPGVQPERLGPYCSTLNPGYDPRLPLYRPWPLFEAIQAAYVPTGPGQSPWDHHLMDTGPAAMPVPTHIKQIAVLAGPGSVLAAQLNALGATALPADSVDAAEFLVVDGTNLPATVPEAVQQKIKRWVDGGATCLVWGASPDTLAGINTVLPKPLILTARTASSYVIQAADPILAGLTSADFYFTETEPGTVTAHGLAGPFVESGQTLVLPCPANWRRWNYQAEPIKTAALLRSEREAKPGGAALMRYDQGKGHYLVSALDTNSGAPDLLALLRKMLTNEGVVLVERKMQADEAFDAFGTLKSALVCGSFGAASAETAYDTDAVGISPTLQPKAGDKSGDREWQVKSAGSDGIFNFLHLGLPGPSQNAAVYLSFWVWSPRPLDNLLLEPNLPKLDMLIGSDDGCQVWLNAKQIQEDRGTHPLVPGSLQCKTMPLQRGWNHFIVKVVQGSGEWQFRADLRCSDPLFLSQLRTSQTGPVTRP